MNFCQFERNTFKVIIPYSMHRTPLSYFLRQLIRIGRTSTPGGLGLNPGRTNNNGSLVIKEEVWSSWK